MVGDDADGAAVLVHDDACAVRPLGQQGERVGDGSAGGQLDRGVQDEVARLDPGDDVGDDLDRDVLGMTTRPPRRAMVSAIRRPAMAVMLATTSGMVVPVPSGEERSTAWRDPTAERPGTMKTSSYVRSYGTTEESV